MTRGRTSMVGGGDHHQITADTARGVDDGQAHSGDMVMPGFRFHPTEEELIEFYLRRKVEGKRFNIELIASVDLYRYDPWDLPALASIGDKEWFFYVPRDRKYRNGDRPNRVTPSGYWKATGADRLVRVDGNREIGLKKTLVFYVGKAPKGIRSSWIMNEYRLPHGEAERYQKIHQEISLCRVYKRSGIEDNFHLTTKKKHAAAHRTSSATPRLTPTMFDAGGHPSPLMGGTTTTNAGGMPLSTLTAAATRAATTMPSMFRSTAASVASLSSTTSTEEDGTSATLYHHMIKGNNNTNPAMLQHLPPSTHALLNVNSSAMASIPIDELSRAIGSYNNNQQQQQANPNNILQQAMQPSSQQSPLLPFASMEKIWDWNPLLESPKVCTSFK